MKNKSNQTSEEGISLKYLYWEEAENQLPGYYLGLGDLTCGPSSSPCAFSVDGNPQDGWTIYYIGDVDEYNKDAIESIQCEAWENFDQWEKVYEAINSIGLDAPDEVLE